MAKRKSASSALEKRVAKSDKSIKEEIDFSEIPELTDQQFRSMKRVGRPPLGTATRQLISLRIDPQVLSALRKLAEKSGQGYQSLINDVLKKFVDKRSA